MIFIRRKKQRIIKIFLKLINLNVVSVKRECSYYELQIRSADESATLFITCLNCGAY